MKEFLKVLDTLLRVATPLIYLYLWYAIPLSLFEREYIDVKTLTVLALPVIFIGVISKQTSWSIGGDKGLKGDNIGRKVRATVDRKGSFDLDGIEMDKEKINAVIEAVTKNPIFTDKQRHDG